MYISSEDTHLMKMLDRVESVQKVVVIVTILSSKSGILKISASFRLLE